jgi:hypothetical protein
MTNETGEQLVNEPPREPEYFLHYCHCGKWSLFGYCVSLREGKEGQWYCAEHRPKVIDGRVNRKNLPAPSHPTQPANSGRKISRKFHDRNGAKP